MDWESPLWLLAAPPLLFFLLWVERHSCHPMGPVRRRWLLVVRALGVLCILAALAGPARLMRSESKAVGFVVDASQSMGKAGLEQARREVDRLRQALVTESESFVVLAGEVPVLVPPSKSRLADGPEAEAFWMKHQADAGAQSDYRGALELAGALFPPGTGRELVLVGDGFETRGDARAEARRLVARGVRIHTLGVAGPRVEDVRVTRLEPNRGRSLEGETIRLTATVEATSGITTEVRLFEKGVEVERRPVTLSSGQPTEVVFERTPDHRDVFAYRAVVEVPPEVEDSLAGNNEALAVVDVRGRMRLLYVETDEVEGQYLPKAMEREGMELDWRRPGNLPDTLEALAGYDGVILSEVSAVQLGESWMALVRTYVDRLGGGLVMLGGPRTFGVGGYFKSPLEEVLPVRLRAPDEEEKQSAAVALVLDRSGSMAGEKLEMAKAAAVATAEVLGRQDHLGVYAFDSEARVVVPMTRLTSTTAISGQVSALTAGGGTNLEPAFQMARETLRRVKARVKHMILLTDGQTGGGGYEALAGACRAEGMTVSTVALGEGAFAGLLQSIAVTGGGQSYTTLNPESMTRIFTQDTLTHTGRMLREEPFEARVAESHPMLAGLEPWAAPPLLGYVKTVRRSAAQVPLVTDTGDPLLAHWRFGLGKATAFTSDAKSRWGSLWVSRWGDYGRFWSQLLRETARPPQGGRMDLAVRMENGEARVRVDLLRDAGTRENEARVTAEVHHIGSNAAPGEAMEKVTQLVLDATGPGWYEGRFTPERAGVYLVRAQAGSETASAGVVHQVSAEASLGRVHEALLRDVAEVTGGSLLEPGAVPVLSAQADLAPQEMWPWLVALALMLGVIDLLVRRWEQVEGLFEGWMGRSRRVK